MINIIIYSFHMINLIMNSSKCDGWFSSRWVMNFDRSMNSLLLFLTWLHYLVLLRLLGLVFLAFLIFLFSWIIFFIISRFIISENQLASTTLIYLNKFFLTWVLVHLHWCMLLLCLLLTSKCKWTLVMIFPFNNRLLLLISTLWFFNFKKWNFS
jgi:hypothetical protein